MTEPSSDEPTSDEPTTDEPTTDAEDLADYTDDHQTQAPPDPASVESAQTPDVADPPGHEPPD